MDIVFLLYPQCDFLEEPLQPVKFPISFKTECKLLQMIEGPQELKVKFDKITIEETKKFYEECIIANPKVINALYTKFSITLPVNSNSIDNHLDKKSIEYLKTLKYKKIIKQVKNTQPPAEGQFIAEETKEQVIEWIKLINQMINFSIYIGFTKLRDVLALSVSVPLYVTHKYDEQLNCIKIKGENPFLTPKEHNNMQKTIRVELENIWEKSKKTMLGFGWGQQGQAQQVQPEEIPNEPGNIIDL